MRIPTAIVSILVDLLYLMAVSRGFLEELLVMRLLHEGRLELLNDFGQLQCYPRLPCLASWLKGL